MTHRRLLIATTLLLGPIAAETAAQQPPTTPSAGATQFVSTGAPVTPTAGQPANPQAIPGVPGIQPNGLQQVPGQQAAAVQPQAPVGFPLNAIDQQLVLQTLQMWEGTSKTVETFNCEFERWEYNAVFGPGSDIPLIKSSGKLSFSKPDKGSFKIEEIYRWTKADAKNPEVKAPGDWIHQPHEIGEHWVCDGKAVYEYNHRDKQLVVTTIPENMRGQNIVDGPLPFLFGADAQKLMNRYWIRVFKSTETDIWLEAYPRWASDAANYSKVDVMLDRKTMQPKGIQVNLPSGEERHAYIFKGEPQINEKNLGSWFTGLFSAPRTPLGWKKVMAEEVAASPHAANPQAPVQR
ncbi:MAG TPA: TIGR03009 domain-containing protein [Lacipirellula sp.]